MKLKTVDPFKVIIVGASYVGKTSIYEAYFDIFNINYKSTIRIDFRIKRRVKKANRIYF